MSGASVRIGLLINLAPRKRGSLEDWIVGLAAESGRRGHRLDVYGLGPVQPEILSELEALGVGWSTIDSLTRSPIRSLRRLARQYDVLHVNLFSTRNPVTALAIAAWPASVLFVDHASRRTSGRGVRAALGGVFDRVLMSRAAGAAAVSVYIEEWDRSRFGFGRPRLRTIYNGVDVARFRPPPRRDSSRPGVTLITVSQLIPEKGVQHAIEVLDGSPPDWRLRVVGDGWYEPNLRDLARSRGVGDRVEFLGLRSDLPDLFRSADIYLHPAKWQEAFGLTVAEAMASGCAVVASRVGAIPELVRHERDGLIVEPGDVNALRASVARLVARPELRSRLGECARERAVAEFDIDRCVREHMDWIEEVVRDGKDRARTAARNHAALR